jgi:biuret amidohydrolase
MTAQDDAILRRRQIDTVLFTGVATNVTVEGTARDAVNSGYNIIQVSDACAAATDEAQDATLATFSLLGKVVSAADIQRALQRHTDGQGATSTKSPALA